jgi:ribose/xylose/arabinose/galactoside ABC-type transport system permease subunit
MLERTWLGRWLEAVGSDARAARVSGVPVAGVTVAAYVLSGVTGAIGSILYTGRLETGSPVMGQRILLDVIGAVVIGGNSLSGGRGRVVWTIYGVVFMTAIDNSLNLLGLSNFGVLMVKGSLIAGAALLDAARNRHAAA